MFRRKLKNRIKSLEEKVAHYDKRFDEALNEVEFLRMQNKDLHNRLMSYASQAFQNYNSIKNSETPAHHPTFVNPLGQIESMEAVTEQDKKDKADALNQVRNIIGAC